MKTMNKQKVWILLEHDWDDAWPAAVFDSFEAAYKRWMATVNKPNADGDRPFGDAPGEQWYSNDIYEMTVQS